MCEGIHLSKMTDNAAMPSSPPQLIRSLETELEVYDTPIYEQFFYHLFKVYLDLSVEIEADVHLPIDIKALLRRNGAKIIMALIDTGTLVIPIQDMYLLPIDEMIAAVEYQNSRSTYVRMIWRIQWALNDIIEWVNAQSSIAEIISDRYLMIMEG
jgi:hypothetical protein